MIRTRQAGADEIEVSPQMVQAGEARLRWLLQAGTGSAYAAEEVYRAMALAASCNADLEAKLKVPS